MTSKERLLKILKGEIPDYVPVAPDFSNMIPARRTGKPFWELYLYNDPPIWEAYLESANFFNIDSMMDGYFPLTFPEEYENEPDWQRYIVFESEDRIVVQDAYLEDGKHVWKDTVDVYYIADPPTEKLKPDSIHLPTTPKSWKPLEGVKPVDLGPAGLVRVQNLMGDQGLVGVWLASSLALFRPEEIYHYFDHPEMHDIWAQERVDAVEKRFQRIMAMDVKPDFLCVGASGTLVYQSMEIFKQLAFPAVKRGIELSTGAGIPTHIHSCGPEKELVKLMVEETNLTVIDPLEIPPMGDCNLEDLKNRFGTQIVLKGNLHTIDVMLNGTVDDVITASKKAIDDAAEGGRFILSTGDQCGRDTPDENLFAMVETARNYGIY
ncbi:uroporphyrinogen decarboxylase family protein [bacterium]